MKHFLAPIAFLLGTVQGIANTAGAANVERSVWVPAPPKYAKVTTKQCATSSDCAVDHVCIQHAWAYNK